MFTHKIISPNKLAEWRADVVGDRSVAVVTGTFDLIQPGNMATLAAAAAHADHVCVVLEADDVVTAHAGVDGRQHALETRADMLSHFRDVDAVTSVDPAEAEARLEALEPFTWVGCVDGRGHGPIDEPAAARAADMVAVPPLDHCFTEDIRRAIVDRATPIVLPGNYDEEAPAGDPAPGNGCGALATANGCFDILHIGHLQFLAQAAATGDRFYVLINDDASVQAYKGANHPVFPMAFRRRALAALAGVSAVRAFSGDTPLDAIAELRPQVHVKGGSYEEERVREERELVGQWGGRIMFCPLVEGYSTSAIVRQILAGTA